MQLWERLVARKVLGEFEHAEVEAKGTRKEMQKEHLNQLFEDPPFRREARENATPAETAHANKRNVFLAKTDRIKKR